MVSPARRAAFLALQGIRTRGLELTSALEPARAALSDPRDRALASELTHGVQRWRAQLDHLIAWAGNRPIDAFDAQVVDVLRLGVYQILHLTRVPASAAVHDAVDQCREVGAPRAAGAVNAILRSISRQRKALPLPADTDPLAFLSVTLSHPDWLAARWLSRLGFERAHAWAHFNNIPAPVVLRAHTWVESRESLAAWLAGQGIETEPTSYAADGLIVRSGNVVADVEGAGRRFSMQDESAQLVATFVGVSPGERVLDTCAAPGGKTTAMAAGCGPAGLVVAGDLRPRRVRLLRRTIDFSGAPGVAIVRADAASPLPYATIFDAVLVDAPCSGLGTIRRDPDVRWRRLEADLTGLADVQVRMLLAASAVVRPGGRLVYATCSSEPEENEMVVARFLDGASGWRHEPAVERTPALPAGVLACLDDQGDLRTAPDRHNLEPFYAACLRAPR
jgi:16S rRNA (cytosine967-C5)-methyltransferase